MSKFQIGLVAGFAVLILVAVFLFSRSQGPSGLGANLTVWGTIDSYDFSNWMQAAAIDRNQNLLITYVEKEASTLDQDFTEALAEGKGPDLVILPLESLVKNKSKLYLMPHSAVRPVDFVGTFISEAQLFTASNGTYAIPLYVDPMVLYWNRDLFNRAALAKPPVYWDEIYNYVSKLTVKDNAGNITQSAIALGVARNIPHEKEILSLLMFQAGTPIVGYSGDALISLLNQNSNTIDNAAESALNFYTQFADPTKTFSTWNRSLLPADTNFVSGKSAMYLGFASELPTLKAKNPTLDLGISPVPQSRISGKVMTFGRLFGVAVSRATPNPSGAVAGALALISKSSAAALASVTPLIPTRLDILSSRPTDPAGFVFYSAALQAKGWLDPDPVETRKIFSAMAESVVSGQARVDEAVLSADRAINALLK